MAKSQKPTPTWGALLEPDARTYERLRRASRAATRLVRCGGGRDAVVIAPLRRGLAALDAMNLPVLDGYSVLADHLRQELIVLVASGQANWAGVPGVRVLSCGSWLLVPACGTDGSLASAWLSPPKSRAPWQGCDGQPCLGRVAVAVDVAGLRDALAAVDRPVLSSAGS
ncbi:hypothetical protein [Streptomyces sp. YIM 121038]|uniref:hypothetical protein n=1 Tax=Streptomyces sp. YIM 121038 TaxID=2136401 RepID=UPI001110AC94|nr:hypothetical protein [Streptomyces sp. YIM 121038]